MQKLTFRLGDPDYTFLHQAGLAGLWMTLQQLEREKIKPPQGINWDLDDVHQVTLSWSGQDFAALDWLFKEAFQLDKGVIVLRGINAKTMRRDAQINIHQGILNTFLQHNSTHKSLEMRREALPFGGEVEDGGSLFPVSYKRLDSYAYQTFANSLCDSEGQLLKKPIKIAGWMHPGAVVRHIAFSSNTSFEELPTTCSVRPGHT
jgi:CRISPR-associated protein Cas8a1/Csx13